MAANWDGKSRGTVFGFKVFVFFIKHFGINAAYMLMHLPVPYFCFKEFQKSKAVYHYFNQILGYDRLTSVVNVYRSYFTFGKTLVDKIAISSGLSDSYQFIFEGENKLREVLNQNQGALLISAHIGNFELAQHFFNQRLPKAQISIVITDQDHTAIKDYLQNYLQQNVDQFIVVKEDLSHIFNINSALQKNQIVCISGDRYLPGSKTIIREFMGRTAPFPKGPFKLASRLKTSVLFVYVMREAKKKYHLYADSFDSSQATDEDILNAYLKNLERTVRKYPLQWFNFYDFWER